MNKIKAFFYIVFKSMGSPSYYKEMLTTKVSFSLKYFVALAVIASTILTINSAITIIPEIRSATDRMLSQLVNIYPEDLVIKSENDEWTINKPEPLVISLPMIENETGEDFPSNFIVFDHEGTIEDMQTLDTLIMVNSKNVLIKNANEYANRLQTYTLKDIPDGEFNKERFDEAIKNLEAFAGYMPYLFVGIVFIGVLVYYFIIRMIYLGILGGLLWILNAILGLNLKYQDTFRIGLHSMTLPLVIQIGLSILRLPLNIVGWYFFMNIFFAVAVMARMAKGEKVDQG